MVGVGVDEKEKHFNRHSLSTLLFPNHRLEENNTMIRLLAELLATYQALFYMLLMYSVTYVWKLVPLFPHHTEGKQT